MLYRTEGCVRGSTRVWRACFLPALFCMGVCTFLRTGYAAVTPTEGFQGFVGGGGGFYSGTLKTVDEVGAISSVGDDAFGGTLLAGVRWQGPGWMVALLGEGVFSSAKNKIENPRESASPSDPLGHPASSDSFHWHNNPAWGAALRLGYTWGAVTPYLRAGWRWLNVKIRVTGPDAFLHTTTMNGFAPGMGVLWHMTPGWQLGFNFVAEYCNGKDITRVAGISNLRFRAYQTFLTLQYNFG